MKSNGISKKVTTGVTFRLEESLVDKLRKESEQKQTSLNTLANQIFNEHIDWHSNATKAGFIPVRKAFLIQLIDRLAEKDILAITEYLAKNESKDFVLLLRDTYDIESALDVIETWMSISGFPHKHLVNDCVHSYIIQHELGRKWSVYLSEMYRFLFEEFGLKKVHFDITDNTVSLTVDIKAH